MLRKGGLLYSESPAVLLRKTRFLVSVQTSREVASSIAGSLALISVIGRMGFGWLGDRMDRRYLLASALLLQALSLVIFAYTKNLAYAIAFVALFGSGFGGAIALILIIQADYFGRKAFGTIVEVLQGNRGRRWYTQSSICRLDLRCSR